MSRLNRGQPLKLQALSLHRAHGIRGVAVKCLDITKNPIAKALCRGITDAEARKCGYQTGLDTLVVRTVNDECSLWAIYCPWPSESVKHSTWGVRRQR